LRNLIDGLAEKPQKTIRNEEQNGIGGLVECLACGAAMHKVQGLFRNEFFQYKLMSVVDNLCWIGVSDKVNMHYTTCKLFVSGSAPTIMEQLSNFLLSPEYVCEVEMEICNRNNFTKLDPQDYIDRVKIGKPEYLANDNYQNFLYQKIASSETERPTLSFV